MKRKKMKPFKAWAIVKRKNGTPITVFVSKTNCVFSLRRDEQWRRVIVKEAK